MLNPVTFEAVQGGCFELSILLLCNCLVDDDFIYH